MIFLAGLLVGIVLTSIASFALLGLCLSSRERDERETLPAPLGTDIASTTPTALRKADLGIEPWISGGDAA